MNVIKKYWDSVYVYVLLLVPGFCMCAGLFWTVCKWLGLYPDLQWVEIIAFDLRQVIYLTIALYFIRRNKKDSSYISGHLSYIKGYIVLALFIQYNFILYLFASVHVWECTFLFFATIVFLFDSKLMFFNVLLYFLSLVAAHMIRPEKFLPLESPNVKEIIAFRIVIFILTSCCIVIIVYFVERFLMQAQESSEENVHLMEKQLEYYKDMEFLDTELRKFRHDIKNHFICMEALSESGKVEELQEYLADLQQSFSFQKKIHFSGNDIVDAILHSDLSRHCSENVNVTVYGSLPEIVTVSSMDLCTLFSNLLSNAVAAANQCADRQEARLAVRFSGGSTYFSIEVANSIPVENEGRKKDRNHGFGIRKIENVVEKYGGRFEKKSEQEMLSITVYLPI